MQKLTICLVIKNNKVLLGMKKRGFGEGWWNGFGGKVEDNETVEDAAKRELYEESNLIAIRLESRGKIEFNLPEENRHVEVNIFMVNEFEGEPKSSEEMNIKWFDFEKLPEEKMWPGDRLWFRKVLDGDFVEGNMLYGPERQVLENNLRFK